MQPQKCKGKLTLFIKLLQKHSCDMHKFMYHVAVLSAITSNTAHHPSSCRDHIAEASAVYDHVTVHPKSFNHESAMMPTKPHAKTKAKMCFNFVLGFS
jgi:hypothetical protein